MKSASCKSCGSSVRMVGPLCAKCYNRKYYRDKYEVKPVKPTRCTQCDADDIRAIGLCASCYGKVQYLKRRADYIAVAKMHRLQLSDAYVRDLLRDDGEMNPTDDLIKIKREAVFKRRARFAVKKETLPPKYVPCMCCGKPRNAGKACDMCMPSDVRKESNRRASKT